MWIEHVIQQEERADGGSLHEMWKSHPIEVAQILILCYMFLWER